MKLRSYAGSMKPAVISLLMLMLMSFISHTCVFATPYYFSTSGSDSNDGLSADFPKKSIDSAVVRMISGNIIYFKRGDIWYIPYKSINLDGRANCTLDAYGDAAAPKPIIAGMALLDGTWTYTGNLIWKYKTTYSMVHRVFVNNVSRIGLHDKLNNTDTLPDLDTVDEYLFDTTGKSFTLYLKTVSAIDTPRNVEVIPAWNTPPVVRIKNSQNIVIKNIEFRGGAYTSTIRIEAPGKNITIDRCIVGRSSEIGIFVLNPLPDTQYVENIVIVNCLIDKGWTLAENNVKNNIHLKGDGIALFHGVKNGLIKSNVVTNWGHDGIALMAYLHETNMYGIKYVKVELNNVYAGKSAYMHAFDMSGLKDKTMYNIIKRNYFHGYSSACTIGGNNNFVFSNIFETVTVSPLLQHKQSPHAINMATWTYVENQVVRGSMESKNNWVCNNTIYGTDTYSILFDRSNTNGDTTTIMNNRIINNLMLNFGMDTIFTRDNPGSQPPPKVALRILNSVPKGTTTIRNNNFWVSYDSSLTKKVALYTDTQYTASQLNNCIQCGGKSTGNLQLDPKLGTFYALTGSSPNHLKTGGFDYKNDIILAQLPASEFVDYGGNIWPVTNISIGAKQY